MSELAFHTHAAGDAALGCRRWVTAKVSEASPIDRLNEPASVHNVAGRWRNAGAANLRTPPDQLRLGYAWRRSAASKTVQTTPTTGTIRSPTGTARIHKADGTSPITFNAMMSPRKMTTASVIAAKRRC